MSTDTPTTLRGFFDDVSGSSVSLPDHIADAIQVRAPDTQGEDGVSQA